MGSTNDEPEREAGHFIHRGKCTYIWDLPEEPEVFNMLSEGKTETIFQLNTTSVTPYVQKIKPKTVEECAVVTSLVRPGPLDFIDEKTGRNMAEEYIERVNGRSAGEIEILNRLLPETHGVFVFQEQITKLTKEMTGWGDEKAEDVRIAVGKKKLKMIMELKPQFINASIENGVDEQTANAVWAMIETFGRYGFNKSHAVAYAMIAYACAYLKYHYPLEWWAAVLSNAEEKEITEVLWPHVRDILSPPDINLSNEEMIIDYDTGTIRNKLSVLRGLGEKVANRITEGRPYRDIEDFIDKKVVGNSLTRKLIHVGVLDSLFDKGLNLMEKMQAYENAVEVNKYKTKIMEKSENEIFWNQPIEKFIEAARVHPKTRRCKHVIKEGKIDLKYAFMDPVKDYLLKKSIFPTMPIALSDLVKHNCKKANIINTGEASYILDKVGREVRLVDGKTYQNITNIPCQYGSDQIVNFCLPAYIVDAKEFPYRNGEKKALKMTIDVDGYLHELVRWPDYETSILTYPSDLKKGSIVFIFMYKKLGKEMYSEGINDLLVENSLDS
jgi:DNA polymerase III alpha subunit